jgi:antitoxin YefM
VSERFLVDRSLTLAALSHFRPIDRSYVIAYDKIGMKRRINKNLTVSEARVQLYRLVDRAAQFHEPVIITGKRNNAVMIGEDDWRAMMETLYLLSIPGMRESIRKGLKTPVEACSERLEW